MDDILKNKVTKTMIRWLTLGVGVVGGNENVQAKQGLVKYKCRPLCTYLNNSQFVIQAFYQTPIL